MVSKESYAERGRTSVSKTPPQVLDQGSGDNIEMYVAIKPVYNGKILDVDPELIINGFGGLSIKHYYGSCVKIVLNEAESEKSIGHSDYWGEDKYELDYGMTFYGQSPVVSLLSKKETASRSAKSTLEHDRIKPKIEHLRAVSSTDSECMDEHYPGEEEPFVDKPECMKSPMNYRNSFWDIHRPELCKLTWPHLYISPAILTSYLHDHILKHGSICEEVHDVKDRESLLSEELDEYVILKEIQKPKWMPPDEKMFNIKEEPKLECIPTFMKVRNKDDRPVYIQEKERYREISDDEDLDQPNCVHRCKAEFCITIGKPEKKVAKYLIPTISEDSINESVISQKSKEKIK